MTVETRARSAIQALMAATTSDVDAHAALGRLRQRRRSHARTYLAAVAVAVLLTLAVGALSWTGWHPRADVPTGVQPTPATSSWSSRTNVALVPPFTVLLPAGWAAEVRSPTIAVIHGPGGASFAVFVDPTPYAGPTAGAPAAFGSEALAHWVGSRPGLQPSTVVAASVSEKEAWAVDVRQRAGQTDTAVCDGSTAGCLPLVHVPNLRLPLGVAAGAETRFIFFDLHSGQVMGIALGADTPADLIANLAAARPVIESIVLNNP